MGLKRAQRVRACTRTNQPPRLRLTLCSRVLARMRAQCPVLPIVFGALAGQGFEWFVGAIWSAIVATFLLPVVKTRAFRALGFPTIVGFALGVASMLVGARTTLVLDPQESLVDQKRVVEHSLLVEVDARPRRPKPGLVVFEARVLEQLRVEESPTHGQHSRIEASLQRSTLLCRAVDLPWRQIAGLKKRDVLMVRATIKPLEPTLSPFDYHSTLFRRGISGTCKVHYVAMVSRAKEGGFEWARAAVRASVISVLGNNERSGLILALVLGERDALSERTENAFRKTGLTHLLVLSGYQVSLVYFTLCWGALSGFRVFGIWGLGRRGVCRVFALVATMMFVGVVGVDSSSLRAALALSAVVAAHLFERQTSLWNSIVLSLLLMSLMWPGAIFEPGVQLTFAALIGIAIGVGLSLPGESRMRQAVRTSLWATLLPMMVAGVWFGEMSLLGLVLNPVMAPFLSAFGTLGGALAMLVAMVGVDPRGFVLMFIAEGLVQVREVIVWLSLLPFASFESRDGYFLLPAFLGGCLLSHAGVKLLRRQYAEWNFPARRPVHRASPLGQ